MGVEFQEMLHSRDAANGERAVHDAFTNEWLVMITANVHAFGRERLSSL